MASQGELVASAFRRFSFDSFVLSYRTRELPTVFVVDQVHIESELEKVRTWRANRDAKVYVHGMKPDGQLILLHIYPSRAMKEAAHRDETP